MCVAYVCLIAPTIVKAEDTQSKSLIFYEIHHDGDAKKLNKDLDAIQQSTKKISVLLDYRSLGDQNILTKIKQTPFFTSGIIIDIDEDLRRDTGVSYTSSWPRSISSVEQTTILGYNKSDRRKLIDTLMHAFERSLGVLPTIASSKIIDTDSANYLKDTYGIQIQIIDEEYKDLSHSTLDGGPSMIPYPASANWLLIPDFQRIDPVWVIRRVSNDMDYSLLKGDRVSKIFFFSNKKFPTIPPRYDFENILKTHTSTSPKKFVTNDERSPSLFYYGNTDVGIYEVITSYYRVRLLKRRGNMWITDIRIYDTKIIDPYNSRIANHGFYQIVPYLLNETGWSQGSLHMINTPEMISRMELPPIRLGSSPSALSIGEYGYVLSYKSEGTQPTIVFNLDSIQMVGLGRTSQKLPFINKNHPNSPIEGSRYALEWKNNKTTMFAALIDCQPTECNITFKSPRLLEMQPDSKQNKYFLFPEPGMLSNQSSAMFVGEHNHLVAERKEKVALTTSDSSIGTIVPPKKSFTTTEGDRTTLEWTKPTIYSPATITITPNRVGPLNVTISLQNAELLSAAFEVVPDCAKNLAMCLWPPTLYKYLRR